MSKLIGKDTVKRKRNTRVDCCGFRHTSTSIINHNLTLIPLVNTRLEPVWKFEIDFLDFVQDFIRGFTLVTKHE
jgi:hypothetical protein